MSHPMSSQARLAALWLCLLSAGPLAAAEIPVAAGTGTLAAAIAGAADGDTLVLGEGGFQGTATIDKTLTLRPVNRATNSLISGALTVSGAGIEVTLQGLKFTGTLSLMQAAAVRLLENTWLAGSLSGSTYRTSEGDGSLVVVGNTFVSGGINSIYTEGAYIAGNTFEDGYVEARASVWIVGNNIRASTRASAIYADINDARIVANRVFCRFSNTSPCTCVDASAPFSLIAGNLIEVEDPDNINFPQYGLVVSGSGYATVINNLVRGTPVSAYRAGYGISVTKPAARVEGNIVLDYKTNTSGAAIVASVASVVAHNLCYNNRGACPAGEGNLDVDPGLVDLVDYRLGAGSPAIDAGPLDYGLADLDRTRNDMGPYGGPWSIGQYDAQRDPAAYAPFVYPLFRADSGFTGGSLEIKALGVARLR